MGKKVRRTRARRPGSAFALSLLIGAPSLLLGACAPALANDGASAEETPGARSESVAPSGGDVADDGSQPRIVATTPIIADLVHAVAPRARIATLVPAGVDPHSFEPSMAALRDIAHADIAFSNGLLLEQSALTSSIDANLPKGAQHVALGEESVPFGARPIPLVEDLSLATIWLGLRVDGRASTDSTVSFEAVSATGPGDLAAFTTGTFGEPRPWIASKDGIDSNDRVELPTNAHTHMSWGFTDPGVYSLSLRATLHSPTGDAPLGEKTLVFAVGVDPHSTGRSVLDSGHADLTAKLEGSMTLRADAPAGDLDPDRIVIAVPDTTTTTIPDNRWRFLAEPGASARILAQAVIGTHVHGEIDPHMWHDVKNAIAYTDLVAERLAALDPSRAAEYRTNAATRDAELEALDRWIREVVATIPEKSRALVTAHDSFGYYANAYGLRIGGFVAPNPSLEPSALQLANLTRVLEQTPAAGVFLEPTSRSHLGELVALAHTTGKSVCSLQSDTLTDEVPTYLDLMVFNTRSIKSCLDPASLPAWPFESEAPIPNPTRGDQ